jgi:ent-kaurene oxidase
MPSLIILASVPILIVATLHYLYRNYKQDRVWSHIPTHAFEDGDNSRERYVRDLKELLESGHRKYSKQGLPFKVKIPIGGYSVKYRVVLPKDHLEEMKHLSNNTFSWALASAVIFAQDFTGAPPRGPWSGKALRVGIHQNLEDITKKLDRQIEMYFETHLPKSPSIQTSIKFMDFFVPAIANITNSLLVDERLSSNAYWIQQTCDFAVNRYKSADDVRAYPPIMATLVSPFISSVRQLRRSRRYVKEQMTPLYEDMKRRQILGALSRESCRKGSFGYEWLWGGAPDDVTLDDFSDTMMRTLIASIHTTAKTISVALIDLLSQAKYIDELRQEARDAMGPDGSIDIEKLFKMDCFLKESQRLTPVFLCKSMNISPSYDCYTNYKQ